MFTWETNKEFKKKNLQNFFVSLFSLGEQVTALFIRAARLIYVVPPFMNLFTVNLF